MHGGFENETPNIPTNSILKLDLIAHVKGNANLLKNLRALFRMHYKSSQPGASASKSADGSSNSSNSRASTPPMQSLGKANMKIRMGKGEIE